MTKPRLRLMHGIWHCESSESLSKHTPIGFGETPAEAYAHWQKWAGRTWQEATARRPWRAMA